MKIYVTLIIDRLDDISFDIFDNKCINFMRTTEPRAKWLLCFFFKVRIHEQIEL